MNKGIAKAYEQENAKAYKQENAKAYEQRKCYSI